MLILLNVLCLHLLLIKAKLVFQLREINYSIRLIAKVHQLVLPIRKSEGRVVEMTPPWEVNAADL